MKKLIIVVAIIPFLSGCWAITVVSSLADVLSIISYFEEHPNGINNNYLLEGSKYNIVNKNLTINKKFEKEIRDHITLSPRQKAIINIDIAQGVPLNFKIKTLNGYLPKVSVLNSIGNYLALEGSFSQDGGLAFVLPASENMGKFEVILENSEMGSKGVIQYEII